MIETAQPNILIVGGSDLTNDDLRKILQNEHQLVFVRNGEEAVAYIYEQKPELILLNLRVNGASGFDLLVRLKETDDARNIPVILLTDEARIEDEERGLRLGAVDYLTQPFHGAIVTARIRIQLDQVKNIRTIERLGMIDPLTDIPNRRLFDMRIKEEWRRAYRHHSCLSMLMLDVDNFKRYNDTYGHPQGDQLLKFIGEVLMDNLHRPSDMAARLGGEEFAVLLGDTDITGAVKVAEDIRRDVGKGIVPTPQGEPTSITISIGVGTIIPTIEGDFADLIQQADKYLYIAKENGRNRVVSRE
ncbi:MAG: diguanylate cyclase [Treponema sp.]|nr:diguanylate cyclase [Treponema sp.]